MTVPTAEPPKRAAALVPIILTALAWAAGGAQAQTAAPAPDPIAVAAERIRAIDSVWSAALQARDLDGVMSNYAEDAVFLSPGRPLLRGKEAIRAWFERQLAVPGYSATFWPTSIVVARSGDMAYEIGAYRVTYRGSDGTPQTAVGKHLVTWEKDAGRWRVTAESISGDSAAAGQRATVGGDSLRPAARVLAAANAITAPGGIDTLERVELGGIPQWISVRGRDRRNPILLYLHGGPGFPTMPVSHRWQRPWEEYFTVVQWDQRGAGKTYAARDTAAVRSTLTVERMLADAEELVRHLRSRYGQDRIVLLGHSWGSVLGVELARRHPEWFSVYIGMGQVVDVAEQERLGYEALVDSAVRARDTAALAELRALAPYPERDGSTPVEKLYAERRWMRAYGGYNRQQPADDYYGALVAMSPVYTEAEIADFGPAIEFSFRALWPQIQGHSIWSVDELRVPVVLLQGVHDLTTPLSLVERWHAGLRAPSKTLVRFDRSAHMIMMEEPGRLFLHLVRDVHPLATAP